MVYVPKTPCLRQPSGQRAKQALNVDPCQADFCARYFVAFHTALLKRYALLYTLCVLDTNCRKSCRYCVISVGKNAPVKLSLIDLGRLVLYIKNKKYTFVPLKLAIMFTTVNNWICKDFIRNLFSRKYFVCINLYRNVFSQLDETIRFRMLSYFFQEIHFDFGGDFVIETMSVLKVHPLFLHEPLRLFTFLEMREEYLSRFPGVKIKPINHEKNK